MSDRMWRILVLGAVLVSAASARAGEITLDQFLDEVRRGNQAYTSQSHSSQGGVERSGEAGLAYSPALFANAQLARDAKLPQLPFFTQDSIVSNTYSLGITQQTPFGLQAKFGYYVTYTNFHNPSIGGGADGQLKFHDASPKIELTQPLWSNGFGAGTRAGVEAAEAQAMASHFGSRYQQRASLAQAEIAYWRLATARLALAVANQSLARAEEIKSWSAKRANLQLADRSDALQAEAAVERRRLDQQTARDEETTSARVFNSARGIDSDAVPDKLTEPAVDLVLSLKAPARSGSRDDVKAAAEQERATRANAELAVQRDLPTLDLFAAYAMNGRAAGLYDSAGDSFDSGKPTQAVGVRFQVPLDFGTLSHSRKGWRLEQHAAAELYHRKVFDQETEWKDLSTRFEQARRRLELARNAEKMQIDKLRYEKERLKRGRSTTYQVILFEQDALEAQLTRIRSQSDVLAVLAQMKLYGDRL